MLSSARLSTQYPFRQRNSKKVLITKITIYSTSYTRKNTRNNSSQECAVGSFWTNLAFFSTRVKLMCTDWAEGTTHACLRGYILLSCGAVWNQLSSIALDAFQLRKTRVLTLVEIVVEYSKGNILLGFHQAIEATSRWSVSRLICLHP